MPDRLDEMEAATRVALGRPCEHWPLYPPAETLVLIDLVRRQAEVLCCLVSRRELKGSKDCRERWPDGADAAPWCANCVWLRDYERLAKGEL